jgi:hypothetical protein
MGEGKWGRSKVCKILINPKACCRNAASLFRFKMDYQNVAFIAT